MIKHEMCNCPRDFNHWLVKNQCGDVPEQVQMDLQYFRNINWAKLRSQVSNSPRKSFLHSLSVFF